MHLVKTTILCCLLLLIGLSACKEKKVQFPSNKVSSNDSTSAEMIKLNQLLIEVETKEIEQYLSTSKHSFIKDNLGYWLTKTETGKGESIKKNDHISIAYQVETLQGDTCYSYRNKLQQHFAVGKLEKQRGFNEALTKLNEGDQALIIVPSNLAFGAMGDTKMIPPRTSLLYRVYSIKITTP